MGTVGFQAKADQCVDMTEVMMARLLYVHLFLFSSQNQKAALNDQYSIPFLTIFMPENSYVPRFLPKPNFPWILHGIFWVTAFLQFLRRDCSHVTRNTSIFIHCSHASTVLLFSLPLSMFLAFASHYRQQLWEPSQASNPVLNSMLLFNLQPELKFPAVIVLSNFLA